MKMAIINAMGGHPVSVYAGAKFDESVRKYRGGEKVLEIPYSGTKLSARLNDVPVEPIIVDGIEIPTIVRKFDGVDTIPDDGNLYLVSNLFVSACQAHGVDTSRLLTIGNPVVDDQGRTIGCSCLVRN